MCQMYIMQFNTLPIFIASSNAICSHKKFCIWYHTANIYISDINILSPTKNGERKDGKLWENKDIFVRYTKFIKLGYKYDS